jgi:hypothetical protein
MPVVKNLTGAARRSLPPKAIQCTSPLCGAPDAETTEGIEVRSFAGSGEGWAVEGTVHLAYCVHGKCRNCGRVFDVVRKDIPVQYASLIYQNCGNSDHIRCDVQQIQLEGDRYVFSAVVRCTSCDRRRTLKKILRNLLEMVRIDLAWGAAKVTFKGKGTAK